MKVLVIGGGGREHALVWKMSQSRRVKKIYAIPGNAGIAELAECVALNPSNIIEIADFVQRENIDLTVVGPELPLSLGIVDEFAMRNLKIFGPSQKAAFIETSKSFAKEFMKKNKIPTADFAVFDSPSEAVAYLRSGTFPVVVKADGLAAGKGVFICKNIQEAEHAVRTIMMDMKFGKSGSRVVVEEFLQGNEISFMVVSDGKRAIPLVSAMDYKKAGEKDTGPNTGGMGSISPSPWINRELFDNVMKSIIYPTIEGLRLEGKIFTGLLYAGLMVTENGPKVLEYNCRFGDPETQAIMLRMKSDIIDLIEGAADRNLYDIHVEWDDDVSGCVVLTSKGYPGGYEKGKKIEGVKRAKAMGVEVFHAGTMAQGGDHVTAGGRVLNVCAKASTLKDTMKKIYDGISFITFDGLTFRRDIGRLKNG
jgi:phosphoribosylamine--glycine ligase